MVCIVIVDSHEEYRNYLFDSLSNQKDFEIAGSGSDSYQALKLVDAHKPDVVLMDADLPQGDGMKTAALIKYRSPRTQVILSGNGDERRIFSVLLSGIAGYITRQVNNELLCHGIRTVYYGGNLLSPELAAKFKLTASVLAGNVLKSRGELRLAQFAEPNPNTQKDVGLVLEKPLESITPSEIHIIALVGQGYSNKEIAEKLRLGEGTIRNYVSSLLQKTGLRNRLQIAIYAMKTGISVPL